MLQDRRQIVFQYSFLHEIKHYSNSDFVQGGKKVTVDAIGKKQMLVKKNLS